MDKKIADKAKQLANEIAGSVRTLRYVKHKDAGMRDWPEVEAEYVEWVTGIISKAILALIEQREKPMRDRIHELEQELNNRPRGITVDDGNIKHFSSGNAPEFDGIKHFQDY